MTRLFVILSEFDRRWNEIGLTDTDLKDLQAFLCLNPDFGDVIPGTGGVRKMRWALPGRGKSGGIRIIYLDVLIAEKIYLLTMYSKNEKGNLSAAEKQSIKALVERLKMLTKRVDQ